MDQETNKKILNASIIWKAIVSAFPLIGNWLVWKIGKGDKVQIGLDPWIGCKESYKIPSHLILDLKNRGYHSLRQIARGNKGTSG
jgi:hypothetical protein